MHYGGYPCDMDKIMKLKKFKFKLIEDLCHAVFLVIKIKCLNF